MLGNEKAPVRVVSRKRQKYLRLRLDPQRSEFVLSAPLHASKKELNRFLEQEKKWMEENWQRLKKREEQFDQLFKGKEQQILYRGKWEQVHIRYETTAHANSGVSILMYNRELGTFEFVTPEKGTLPPDALKENFLQRLAKYHLPQSCRETAQRIGANPNRIYVRSQKTKWGSCSSKNNISLNWRLILCPDWIIEYLLVHELTHLSHFNHSKQFWAMVDSHFPRRKEAETWLRKQEAMLFSYLR